MDEFVYLVFTCMPGGVTVGDSGLCCCVPRLLRVVSNPTHRINELVYCAE